MDGSYVTEASAISSPNSYWCQGAKTHRWDVRGRCYGYGKNAKTGSKRGRSDRGDQLLECVWTVDSGLWTMEWSSKIRCGELLFRSEICDGGNSSKKDECTYIVLSCRPPSSSHDGTRYCACGASLALMSDTIFGDCCPCSRRCLPTVVAEDSFDVHVWQHKT